MERSAFDGIFDEFSRQRKRPGRRQSPALRLAGVAALGAPALAVLLQSAGLQPAAALNHDYTTYVVTTTDNSGAYASGVGECATGGSCSFVQAIDQYNSDPANQADEIIFAARGTFGLGAKLEIDNPNGDSLKITGNGPTQTVIEGGNDFGLLLVNTDGGTGAITVSGIQITDAVGGGIDNGGASLTLTDSELDSNYSGAGAAVFNEGSMTASNDTFSGNSVASEGGAVYNDAYGTFIATNDTFSGNTASSGGAVYNYTNGTFIATNDTFSGNSASSGDGGAVYNYTGATFSATNSTFSDDSATPSGDGGAIFNSGTATITGSILSGLANSSEDNTPDNCAGGSAVTDGGYNVADDTSCDFGGSGEGASDAQIGLEALGDNGGPTETQAIPVTSLAASIQVTGCPSTDQRGHVRPATGCSAGAYQVTPATFTVPTTPAGPGPISGTSGPGTTTTTTTTTSSPPPPSSGSSHGYWLVGSDGGIFTFGSAQFYGSAAPLHLVRPVVGISPTSDRGGYFLVASDGGVFNFGDAQDLFYGSLPSEGFSPAGSGLPHALSAPIVAMVPSTDDHGYFLVGSDGGVFTFGDARFEGSCPSVGGCFGRVIAVAPDATGNGYWVFTSRGTVYPFGDAPHYAYPGPQSVPAVDAVAAPDGEGYYILFANGAVANYGPGTVSAGSPVGQISTDDPATAIFTTSDGGGYWVVTASGQVFNYGDAPADGGVSALHLNGPIVAANGS